MMIKRLFNFFVCIAIACVAVHAQDIDEIISKAVSAGKLTATHNGAQAIRDTSISLICVGTPSLVNGSLDLKYVRNVCEQIGEALKDKQEFVGIL